MAVYKSKWVDEISRASDQKAKIFELVGNLADIDIIGDLVLVAVHIRSERTAGGIIRPGSALEEDVWQGKAGLVLKYGPDAFRDDNGELYDQHLDVGDWGVFKTGDAWSIDVRGVPCRLVRDIGLRMKLKDPNIVF